MCDVLQTIIPYSSRKPFVYELLTIDDTEKRDACFAKLPDRVNPVVLIPRIGLLIRHEVDMAFQPTTPRPC